MTIVITAGRAGEARCLLLGDAAVAGGRAGLEWLGAAAEFQLDRDLRPGYDALEDPGYPARIARLLEA